MKVMGEKGQIGLFSNRCQAKGLGVEMCTSSDVYTVYLDNIYVGWATEAHRTGCSEASPWFVPLETWDGFTGTQIVCVLHPLSTCPLPSWLPHALVGMAHFSNTKHGVKRALENHDNSTLVVGVVVVVLYVGHKMLQQPEMNPSRCWVDATSTQTQH